MSQWQEIGIFVDLIKPQERSPNINPQSSQDKEPQEIKQQHVS